MCWDRELVMQAGLGPRLRSPLRLVLCWPAPPAHSGHWVLPEGRGHASSTSLDLKECGEAQDKRAAAQVEGSAYTFRGQLCAAVAQSLCLPLHPIGHPSPPCFGSREACPLWTVSAGLCSQASRWVCPTGGSDRSSQGRRGKMVSIPLAACLRGGRVTVVHSSTQGQPSLAMVTRPPPAPQGRSGITASCCCWRASWFAVPCCCPS